MAAKKKTATEPEKMTVKSKSAVASTAGGGSRRGIAQRRRSAITTLRGGLPALPQPELCAGEGGVRTRDRRSAAGADAQCPAARRDVRAPDAIRARRSSRRPKRTTTTPSRG